MDFTKAVKLIKEDKKLRLPSWDEASYIYCERNNEKQDDILFCFPSEVPFNYPSSIMLSNEWQTIGEDESKLFEFEDAIEKVIKNDNKIKLSGWNKHTWIYLNKIYDELYIRKVCTSKSNLTLESMKSNDWELLGE